MTLNYSGSDSLTDGPVSPAANDWLHCSDEETADCRKADPLSTYRCSTSLISASDQTSCMTLGDSSNQENMQFICLEAAADSEASIRASSTLVAAAAVDGDDDDNILCEPHDALYHVICSRLRSLEDVVERRRLCDSLGILLRFFETEYLLADTSSSESSPAFPLYLIEQYTKLIEDDVGFYSTDG